MGRIVAGEATDVQTAALLTALRAKGETAAEVAGFVEALQISCVRVDVPGVTADIAGTGGDGTGAVNISTMAAIVAAATGVTMVKHGGRASSSTTAGAADLVEELGVTLTPEDPARVAAEAGITFLFAPRHNPGLRHAAAVRCDLGVPTVFNILGPLINPALPRFQVVGVADARMAPVIAGALAAGGRSALVVRGDDGLDKLTTTTTSKVWTVRDGRSGPRCWSRVLWDSHRLRLQSCVGETRLRTPSSCMRCSPASAAWSATWSCSTPPRCWSPSPGRTIR